MLSNNEYSGSNIAYYYDYYHSINMSSGTNNHNNLVPMDQSPDNDFADAQSNFDQFPDLSMFDDWPLDDDSSAYMAPTESMPHPVYQGNQVGESGGSSSQVLGGLTGTRENEGGLERRENRERVAFKTQSEVEILDDGFKWRKYGKKMVKNSPNPRNYYRCSVEGCPVKKRVERDREDPRYVITTYEGIHNHQSSF